MNTLFMHLLIPIVLAFFWGARVPERYAKAFIFFILNIAIPLIIIARISSKDFFQGFDWHFINVYVLSLVVPIMVSIKLFKKQYIKYFLSFYINSSLFTLPVCELYLHNSKAPIFVSMLQLILINPLLLFLLQKEKFRGEKNHHEVIKVFPLILAPFIGLGLFFSPFCLPCNSFFMMILGRIVTIGSFMILGLSLRKAFVSAPRFGQHEYIILGLKNFIQPFLAMLIGVYIFPLGHFWLKSMLICTLSPGAFLINIYAENYESYQRQTPLILAASTVISLCAVAFFSGYLNS